MNRRGPVVVHVLHGQAADRGAGFEFDVDFGPFPVSTWRYDFGTSVTGPPGWSRPGSIAGRGCAQFR